MSNTPSMTMAFPLLNRPAPLPLGELYIDVARAWIALGKLPEARQALERSFLAGEHACTWQAHYMIGEIGLYQDNDLNGAVKSLAQAALLAPPEQIATLIDRVHRPLHEKTDIRHVQWLATTWYREITQRELPDDARAEAERLAGRAALYAANPEHAFAHFDRALEIWPADARLLEGIGEAHMRLGDAAAAVIALRHALASAGEYQDRIPTIKTRLAHALLAHGEPGNALRELDSIPSVPERWRVRYELIYVQASLAAGEVDDAFALADRLSREVGTSDTHVLRARALVSLQRYTEAVESADAALHQDPSNNSALFVKIQALFEGDGDADEADRLLGHLFTRVGKAGIDREIAATNAAARDNDGNLIYFLARVRLVCDESYDAEAIVRELDAALEAGLRPDASRTDEDTQYPEAAAHAARARLLERLGRTADAANDYLAAGQRRYWVSRYTEALPLLHHVRTLAPEKSKAVWYIVDIERLVGYEITDKDKLRANLEAAATLWHETAEAYPPTDEDAWAYVVVAYVHERLGDLSRGAEETRQYWRAVAAMELALLLGNESARNWSALSRQLRSFAPANALLAAQKCLALDPNDMGGREELAAALINMSRNAIAVDELDDLLSREISDDARSLYIRWKALCLRVLEDAEAAVALLDQPGVVDENDGWTRRLRAECLYSAGEIDRALADHQFLYDNRDNPEVGEDFSTGLAALRLGLFRECEAVSQRLLKEYDGHSADPYAWLAEIALREGRLDDARDHIESHLRESRAGSDIIVVNIQHIAKAVASEHWLHETEISQMLLGENGWLQTARQLRTQLSELTPQEELDQISRIVDEQVAYVPQLALGRVHRDSRRWGNALVAYQRAAELGAPERAVKLGTAHTHDSLRADALRYAGDANPWAAQRMLDLLPESAWHDVDVLICRGIIAAVDGSPTDAAELFVEASAALASVADNEFVELAERTRRTFTDVDAYWAVDDVLATLAQSNARWEEARTELRLWLADHWQATGGESPNFYLAVGAVALDAGTDLYEKNAEYLEAQLAEMCERIHNDIGIRIPHPRLRESTSMRGEQYILSLRDVQVVQGSIRPSSVWCPRAIDQLRSIGFDDQNLCAAPHPVSGSPGTWINLAEPRLVEIEELTWHPVRYAVAHLEAIIRQHLDELVGLDETRAWFDEMLEQPTDENIALAVNNAPTFVLIVGRLLRALISEGVPVTLRQDIASTALEYLGAEPGEMLAAARRRLRSLLPGSEKTALRVPLPQHVETLIRESITEHADRTFLAMTPERASVVIEELRSLLQFAPRGTAVVATDAAVRRGLASFMELEWPHIYTLSADELGVPLPMPIPVMAT